jgi:hypothetical protein
MDRRIKSALAALILAVGSGAPAAAQVAAEGSVKFGLLSVEGLVVGTTIKIDADFAAEHNTDVPLPFSLLVPLADDVVELVDYMPEGPDGPFLKLNFATEDRQLIENIQFVRMTIAPGPDEQRLNALAGLMANEVFKRATEPYAEYVRDIVRKTKVGELDGVEVIGRYKDPNLGLMYLRIVGVYDPDGPHGVFTVANVVAARQELATPDDFPRTRGGAAIKHFKLLKQ